MGDVVQFTHKSRVSADTMRAIELWLRIAKQHYGLGNIYDDDWTDEEGNILITNITTDRTDKGVDRLELSRRAVELYGEGFRLIYKPYCHFRWGDKGTGGSIWIRNGRQDLSNFWRLYERLEDQMASGAA